LSSGSTGGSGAGYLYQLLDVDDNAQYASSGNLLVASGSNIWAPTSLNFSLSGALTWNGYQWEIQNNVGGSGGGGGGSGGGAAYLYDLNDVNSDIQFASGGALIFRSGDGTWFDTVGVPNTNNSLLVYFEDWSSPGHALVLESGNDTRKSILLRGGLNLENSSSGFYFNVATDAVNINYLDVTMSGLPTSDTEAGIGSKKVWVDGSGYLRLS
jgi:hypothetical protein